MKKSILLPVAALLLIAPPTTFVSGFSSSTSKAAASTKPITISTLSEWQDELLEKHAQPLTPTPFSQALETLRRDGVVRIDGRSVKEDLCATLRLKILDEISSSNNNNNNKDSTTTMLDDKKYVPGTRLRFDLPMDLAFAGDVRHDLLLPLHNNCPELPPVLCSAAAQLEPLLVQAAESLLPRLYGSQQQSGGLEVVEVASLIVRPGSGHQAFHGDYRRFRHHQDHSNESNIEDHDDNDENEEEPLANTKSRMGRLPPRLVSFVALQDVPTNEHGATGFVTGTNNAQAHELVYEGQGIEASSTSQSNNNINNNEAARTENVRRNRQSILEIANNRAQGVRTTLGMRRGDMLVYDASVLHWGGANSVPNNDRAMLYFGVALPGAAAMLCEKPSKYMESFEIVPPILLNDLAASSLP